MIPFHIGIDDTDSIKGMCTTFLGSLVFIKLGQIKPLIELEDFPYLIRLNPNIPYKTRGNGAVVIRGKIDPSKKLLLQAITIQLFNNFVVKDDPNTNPGLVFCFGRNEEEKDCIPRIVYQLADRSLWDVIQLSELEKFKDQLYPGLVLYGNNLNRGLIGALAAIGTKLKNRDHTFELLIYRSPPYNLPRNPNIIPVKEQEGKHENVFNCFDSVNNTVMIFPRGPDPVFCGIRGENPRAVWTYWEKIQPQPKPLFWMIFRSNQGTDMHLNQTPITSLKHNLKPHQIVKIKGKVNSTPMRLRGGHFNFYLENVGKKIQCFAYEPTKQFRFNILQLIPGDLIEVGGALRPPSEKYPLTLNLEWIKILKLQPLFQFQNPLCPKCSKRMKSQGKNQGFKCKKCKTRKPKDQKYIIELSRNLKNEKIYLPAKSAQRHLTKPHSRYVFKNNKPQQNHKLWLNKILTQNLQY